MFINQLTDAELFNGVKAGSQDALGELYNRYFLYLVRFAGKICNDFAIGEDLAAESFVQLWKAKDKIKDAETVKGYLSMTAKNLSLNYLKKRKKIKYNEEADIRIPDINEDIESRYVDAETYRLLLKLIADLTEDERRVVELLIEGYSGAEIMILLNKSQQNVSLTKKRAVRKLSERFKQYFNKTSCFFSFRLSYMFDES